VHRELAGSHARFARSVEQRVMSARAPFIGRIPPPVIEVEYFLAAHREGRDAYAYAAAVRLSPHAKLLNRHLKSQFQS
jgi:hypothetical protein